MKGMYEQQEYMKHSFGSQYSPFNGNSGDSSLGNTTVPELVPTENIEAMYGQGMPYAAAMMNMGAHPAEMMGVDQSGVYHMGTGQEMGGIPVQENGMVIPPEIAAAHQQMLPPGVAYDPNGPSLVPMHHNEIQNQYHDMVPGVQEHVGDGQIQYMQIDPQSVAQMHPGVVTQFDMPQIKMEPNGHIYDPQEVTSMK